MTPRKPSEDGSRGFDASDPSTLVVESATIADVLLQVEVDLTGAARKLEWAAVAEPDLTRESKIVYLVGGPRPGAKAGGMTAWPKTGLSRARIWPVQGGGNRRGWPYPDISGDECGAESDYRGFLPWAVWQSQPDWYIGFYSCDHGHAWTMGYADAISYSQIREFRRSPLRLVPSNEYLRRELHADVNEIRLRIIEWPEERVAP